MSEPNRTIAQYPRFITLEGIEGAGKSTAVNVVRQALEATGHEVVQTREPGGTPMAESIRSLVLDPRDEDVVPEAELLMMFAARAQHVHHVIRPALERGAWVICDRFTCSSFAYQGHGRGVSIPLIRALELDVVRIAPSLTLFLDVSVDVGLERARQRRGGADRIESERREFFTRASDGFVSRAMAHPDRYKVVHADRPASSVEKMIRAELKPWILEGLRLGPEPVEVP